MKRFTSQTFNLTIIQFLVSFYITTNFNFTLTGDSLMLSSINNETCENFSNCTVASIANISKCTFN